MNDELKKFLDEWVVDPLPAKPMFMEFYDYLSGLPGVTLDFNSRPGVSRSLRAKHSSQKNREVFILVDVVDDDPENRWLSVCFYADMISDPEDRGDFVPAGLSGEDAACFNLDESDPELKEYVLARAREAAGAAAA